LIAKLAVTEHPAVISGVVYVYVVTEFDVLLYAAPPQVLVTDAT
jgi:hypothetical protein